MHRFSLLLITALVAPAISQAVETIPDTVIPKRPSEKLLPPPTFKPESKPGFELPEIEKEILPEDKATQIKIQLNGVRFDGNTLFSNEELQTIAKPFIGRAITVTELEELRQKITKHYIDAGYVNSGAVLPEQKFEDGIIRFDIVEGTLTEIRVSGTEWLNEDYVSDRLNIGSEEHLNINTLRDRFQLLLLDPLIERMNAELIPGSHRGESILDIDVTRATPYQLSLGFNNFRPPSVGSDQGILSGWVRNLTTFGDQLSVTLTYGEGSLGLSSDFSVPLNAYETRFNAHVDISDSAIIEEPLDEIDIESKYVGVEVGLTQPIIKAIDRNFDVGVSFAYKENRTTLLGEPFSFSEGAVDGVTKESVLRFTMDFTERWPSHILSARSVLSVGINTLNATWHDDEFLADSDFVVWLGQMQYAGQIFDTDGILILRGNLQYTSDKLMPLERFALGGRYSVRGYRQNEVVRDKGFVVSAELRYPLLNEGVELPGELTLFTFMDYGGAWNHGEKDEISYLHSTGVGLEWQPFKYLHTELIYAHDLIPASKKSHYNLQDSGVHWQFTVFAF